MPPILGLSDIRSLSEGAEDLAELGLGFGLLGDILHCDLVRVEVDVLEGNDLYMLETIFASAGDAVAYSPSCV